ncbi:LuxR family transcriptional regulator [Pseudomonas sp. 148P]|uniref:LuxR family transcriptional regulator n=1 Tax=Pseudomonas ulcerans TaxID=3115852 RepID=A0ABU7HPF4_9PSED|nr:MULTISPECIES: LuxR family transcriptional regulator [unclassified Pseudomonas]MEE1920607.1 LuxR family transcriptional regulator [Pseudomonas sp. 147P]MEE1933389.1 LuxR family transcriptional regulator [Pseudomonas sp. 148P]
MYASPTLGASQLRAPAKSAQLIPQELVRLTLREKVVLQWSAEGKTSWEIAHILQCSESAVNFHFCNIRRKFGVTSRSAAMLKALALGLIKLR